MAIVSLDEAKLHMRIDFSDEDALIGAKVEAAQAHLERLIGYPIETTYGGEGQEAVPAPLKEAVLQLASSWYGQREATIVEGSVGEVPFSIADIVREYRQWSF